MAGRVYGFQFYIIQFNAITIVKAFVRVGCAGKFAYIKRSSCSLVYLQVRAYKISMRMGFNYANNISLVQSGKIVIRLRIAAGVDNYHFPGAYYRIRCMGKALIVKLIDDHKNRDKGIG